MRIITIDRKGGAMEAFDGLYWFLSGGAIFGLVGFIIGMKG